jgi:hypothetical protein
MDDGSTTGCAPRGREKFAAATTRRTVSTCTCDLPLQANAEAPAPQPVGPLGPGCAATRRREPCTVWRYTFRQRASRFLVFAYDAEPGMPPAEVVSAARAFGSSAATRTGNGRFGGGS